jgi:hypothetical protein
MLRKTLITLVSIVALGFGSAAMAAHGGGRGGGGGGHGGGGFAIAIAAQCLGAAAVVEADRMATPCSANRRG